MTQREHRQQGRVASLVAEVVAELAACELRTAVWLGSDELGVTLAAQVVAHEGEGNTAEVGTAAEAGNYHVGIFASHLHLLLCLQTDNGLMQAHVVEHGTERVLTVRSGGSQLNSLGDGGAE